MGKSIFALLIILVISIPVILLACMYVFKSFWTNQA